MPELRLSPFPDDVTTSGDRWKAIAFLRGLSLPAHIATTHLARWAAYNGQVLTAFDYAQVKGQLHTRSL